MKNMIYALSILKLLSVTGQDMVDKHYNIGQLARAAGVPISTLRYYERVELLHPTGRTRSNYRFYTQDTLQIVRFIRAAQATGFTLEDVRTLLTLWNGHTALCKDVQPLVAKRLEEVTQRLKDMRHIQRILTSMLAMCHQQEQNAACPVIDKLTAALS
jgi:MerR family mercuric resistance operon transcriptional regulator